MQIEPAGPQEAMDRLEIGLVIVDANSLEHADGGDGVETLGFQIIVVDDLHAHLVGEAARGDLFARQRRLLHRESDAQSLNAIMLRRMADQRAPAAADVQMPRARLEAQFAADHVELVELGLVDVIMEIGGVIGAGIDHLLVEEELIEGVRHVVVMGDILLVGGGVAAPQRLVVAPPPREAGTAGRGDELEGRLEQGPDADGAQGLAHLARRPQGGEIKDGPVHPVDPPIHMQADEGVEARAAHEARQRAHIRDGDPQRRGAARGRDFGSIPEQEAELQIERRDSAGEEVLDGERPLVVAGHGRWRSLKEAALDLRSAGRARLGLFRANVFARGRGQAGA